MTANQYLCYLIVLDQQFTYIGVTNNFSRRIRQHNREIKGGAKYTTNLIQKHQLSRWKVLVTVERFPLYPDVLQFEWMWKHLSRKLSANRKLNPIQRRLTALSQLLNRERATTNSLRLLSDMKLEICWHGEDNQSAKCESQVYFESIYHPLIMPKV